MKTPIFDFKKHQNYHKSWKMLIRFVIYGAIIFFLLYLIFVKNKEPSTTSNQTNIDYFDIEILEQQSE